MSSGKRALRNTVLGATSLGFQAIVSLIVSVVIARALGPERTGVYAFCMWLASILTLPAKLGMELPLSKYISEYLGRGASEKAAAVARYFLNVQSVVALALGVIYVSVVETLVAAPARNRLLIVLVIVLIAANRDVLAAILTGAQEYGVLLITSVIVGVVHVGGVLAVALMHGDVGPMLAAVAFGVAAGSVFSGIRADRIMGGGPREALPNESRTRIWRFIRSAFWLGIFYTIVWQRTEISILRTFSPAADIAYFFIGFAMVEKLEAAMSTFTAALLPISSERYGESGRPSGCSTEKTFSTSSPSRKSVSRG